MQHKEIIALFEAEMWQYLDCSLSEKQMRFWEEKINQLPELQEMLKEQDEIIQLYNTTDIDELGDSKFKYMIEKAISEAGIWRRLKALLKIDGNNFVPKMAFSAVVLIASFVVLLISKNPNPVNSITNVANSWSEDSIDNGFESISLNISFLENEDLRRYYFYSRTKNEWDREIFSIKKEVNNLINEANSQQ